jgi:hypothetical protein
VERTGIYHRCRFKFRFHRIIVTLVAYGTEVGRVLRISFSFSFYGVVLSRKQRSSSSSPRRLFALYRCRDFCVSTAASGVPTFFLRGREKGVGKGREELSGCVCVCVCACLVFVKMFLFGLIS